MSAYVADKILQKYWKTMIFPVNVITIANAMDLKVYKNTQKLSYNSPPAMLFEEQNIYKIIINDIFCNNIKRFFIGYEIARFVLEYPALNKINQIEYKDYMLQEQMCSDFTFELLMPKQSFKIAYDLYLDAQKIAETFGVDTNIVYKRINQLG